MVVLSLQSLFTRLTGMRLSLPRLRQLTPEEVQALVSFPEQAQSVRSSLAVLQCLEQEIRSIEESVRETGRTQPGYALLQTVPGIGPILAGTILLEAGDIRRFTTVGHFASYCRCVGSEHVSNGKRKGAGNTKNGNKYLSWAFIEAAHFAIRYEAVIRSFYQRKRARTHPLVALKAVAHKLARACYHMLRDQMPFDLPRAFA
ncbi:MAG: hypothetical protein NTAFB01_20560 [Nitrospira sp.]